MAHLSASLSEWYEDMLEVDLNCATIEPPSTHMQQNSIEKLLLGVVKGVVTSSDCDVGRRAQRISAFEDIYSSHELVVNICADERELREVPTCFEYVPLLMGVSQPPLMPLRSSAEEA